MFPFKSVLVFLRTEQCFIRGNDEFMRFRLWKWKDSRRERGKKMFWTTKNVVQPLSLRKRNNTQVVDKSIINGGWGWESSIQVKCAHSYGTAHFVILFVETTFHRKPNRWPKCLFLMRNLLLFNGAKKRKKEDGPASQPHDDRFFTTRTRTRCVQLGIQPPIISYTSCYLLNIVKRPIPHASSHVPPGN